eukprot:508605-Rhodomonas_salina.2
MMPPMTPPGSATASVSPHLASSRVWKTPALYRHVVDRGCQGHRSGHAGSTSDASVLGLAQRVAELGGTWMWRSR